MEVAVAVLVVAEVVVVVVAVVVVMVTESNTCSRDQFTIVVVVAIVVLSRGTRSGSSNGVRGDRRCSSSIHDFLSVCNVHLECCYYYYIPKRHLRLRCDYLASHRIGFGFQDFLSPPSRPLAWT